MRWRTWAAFGLILYGTGCNSDVLLGDCGACDEGYRCVAGECLKPCNRTRDCDGCDQCSDGYCRVQQCPTDPCSLCTAAQVCFGKECLPGCTGPADCATDEVCFAAEGGGVCLPSDRITTVIPTSPTHVSSDANVTVKGGIRWVGGVSSSATHTVTPGVD